MLVNLISHYEIKFFIYKINKNHYENKNILLFIQGIKFLIFLKIILKKSFSQCEIYIKNLFSK